MFKPTQSMQKMLRRLPLSPKQAGKEYYKGNRIGNMGTIDRYGQFHPDFSKIRTFVFPAKGTKNFELTPFVSPNVSKFVQEGRELWSTVPKAITGEQYLAAWKEAGGSDVVQMPYDDAQPRRENLPEVYEVPRIEQKK